MRATVFLLPLLLLVGCGEADGPVALDSPEVFMWVRQLVTGGAEAGPARARLERLGRQVQLGAHPQQFPPALRGIEDPVAPFLMMLAREDPGFRIQALVALRDIGPPARGAVPALMDMIGAFDAEDDWIDEVVLSVVDRLEPRPEPWLVARLIELSREFEEDLSEGALRILGGHMLGVRVVVERLVEIAELDLRHTSRAEAVKWLGGAVAHRDVVIAALRRLDDPELSELVAVALVRLGVRDPDLFPIAERYYGAAFDVEGVDIALHMIESGGLESGAKLLMKYLRNGRSAELRANAARALADVDHIEVRAELTSATGDMDAQVREAARAALARVNARDEPIGR